MNKFILLLAIIAITKATPFLSQISIPEQDFNNILAKVKTYVLPQVIKAISPITNISPISTSANIENVATAQVGINDIEVYINSINVPDSAITVANNTLYTITLQGIQFTANANGQISIQQIPGASLSEKLSVSGTLDMTFQFIFEQDPTTQLAVFSNFQMTYCNLNGLNVQTLLKGFFSSIGNAISSAANTVANTATNVANTIANGATGAANTVANGASNTANSISSEAQSLINQIGNVPQELQTTLESTFESQLYNIVNNQIAPQIETQVNQKLDSSWYLSHIFVLLHYAIYAVIALGVLFLAGVVLLGVLVF